MKSALPNEPPKHPFRGLFKLGLIILILLFLAVAALVAYMFFYHDSSGKIWFFGQDVPAILRNFTQSTEEEATEPETKPESHAQELLTEAEPQTEQPKQTEPETEDMDPAIKAVLSEAAVLAAGYDYDAAIAMLTGIENYESNEKIMAQIEDYRISRDECVPVDVTTVPHIFYHSLVNEPELAFSAELLGESQANGMNAWMTTVKEFDTITQQLYDNGYVYVRLKDLVVEQRDAAGNVTFAPNDHLMLPIGKKAIVLSIDDLSYYHSYEKASFPDKLVIDEEGKVKCHYINPKGEELIGDYDVVPRLNTFLEEHPDGAYHGARGMIAMTGYNGVFGYRTDADYEEKKELQEDQVKWLEQHPDFDRSKEIEEAKKIAQALKDEGWEFASHTWGHLSVTAHDLSSLITDNEKWMANVQNIIGPTDIIIFAHGNDIGSWMGYDQSNKKYAYYHDAGFRYFCNVDSSASYWQQITDEYVRQGRIDLDGYLLYKAITGKTDVLNGLIDAEAVFDDRRPTPVIAQGE